MQRLIGSHLSIAGGYYKAADAAGALGMPTVQIFTKNDSTVGPSFLVSMGLPT